MSKNLKKDDENYVWTNSDVKLVFKDISFQAQDEYAYVKSVDDIMYLYYTVEIYVLKEKEENDEVIHYWDLLIRKNTYDFPNIINLQRILHYYLEDKIPEEECNIVHFYYGNEIIEDRVGYQHFMNTDGFLSDDYYQVERMIIKEDLQEVERCYSIYAGASKDIQGGTTTIGVKTQVSEEELSSLYDCITCFLNSAIKRNNKEVKEELIKKAYFVDEYNRLVKTEEGKIVEIFVEGTKLDMLGVRCGDLYSEDFFSKTYHNVTIKKIDKNEITITGGYCNHRNEDYNKSNKTVSLPITNIIFAFSACSDEILKMNEEDIAEDFKNILTQEELHEIKTETLKNSYARWHDVIVDRYIMFREEHPFEKVKEQHQKNVETAIKTVLKLLKKK